MERHIRFTIKTRVQESWRQAETARSYPSDRKVLELPRHRNKTFKRRIRQCDSRCLRDQARNGPAHSESQLVVGWRGCLQYPRQLWAADSRAGLAAESWQIAKQPTANAGRRGKTNLIQSAKGLFIRTGTAAAEFGFKIKRRPDSVFILV